MADKPRVQFAVIEMDELLARLQPTIEAIRALVKPLAPPDHFLIYPMLTAIALFEMVDGDIEAARGNHANFNEMVILAFLTMRNNRDAGADNVVPLNKVRH